MYFGGLSVNTEFTIVILDPFFTSCYNSIKKWFVSCWQSSIIQACKYCCCWVSLNSCGTHLFKFFTLQMCAKGINKFCLLKPNTIGNSRAVWDGFNMTVFFPSSLSTFLSVWSHFLFINLKITEWNFVDVIDKVCCVISLECLIILDHH